MQQNQQNGFRRGRGTADGIFVTKRLQHISDKMQKPMFLLIIILNTAFDHVLRKWLFDFIYIRFPQQTEPNGDHQLKKIHNNKKKSVLKLQQHLLNLSTFTKIRQHLLKSHGKKKSHGK